MKDEADDTASPPRGRKRYDARRVRKLICLNSRLDAVAAEIAAFKDQTEEMDRLIAAIGDLYETNRACGQDDAALMRWSDSALVAHRQLRAVVESLNEGLAEVLNRPRA